MIVYLLHFDSPISDHAKHYLGCTDNLEQRITQHKAGQGARLVAVAKGRGIGFVLARTWDGEWDLERKLKRQKNSPRLCPICRSIGETKAMVDRCAETMADIRHAVEGG